MIANMKMTQIHLNHWILIVLNSFFLQVGPLFGQLEKFDMSKSITVDHVTGDFYATLPILMIPL